MTIDQRAKILIIDDDEIILMQVEQILEKNGYAVVSANNGQLGLQQAMSEQPNLILLDRRMPGMDGNETLIQLKENDNTKTIPVVMLTGDNQVSDVSTNFSLGAVDYIVKPFDKEHFLLRLQRILQNSDCNK